MELKIILHKGDLPADLDLGNEVAVDTEAMGLNHFRDGLCLVQLSKGNGECHLVQLDRQTYEAPNLVKLMENENVLKIFHFARFDVSAMLMHLGVMTYPIFCTKIASKIGRTFTDKHGLRELCKELLDIDISKHQQTSDWGSPELTKAQLTYAATDVLHLHRLKHMLVDILKREDRELIAKDCFNFIPSRALLDVMGYSEMDVFAH